MVESSLSDFAGVHGSFPKSCLEQLFLSEPVSTYFCKTELYKRNKFSEILKRQNAKDRSL